VLLLKAPRFLFISIPFRTFVFSHTIFDILQSIPITLIRKKVKNARIVVKNSTTVELIVPHRYSELHVDNLVESKRDWILKALAKVKSRENAVQLQENERFIRGKIYIIHERFIDTPFIDYEHARLYGRSEHFEGNKYIALLKREAKVFLPKRLRELAEEFGFRINKISIRSQSTRWGSCSSDFNISLNWKLLLVPPFVCDYVLLHELVHTEHLNHSEHFWKRLSEVCPYVTQSHQWQKQFGRAVLQLH